MNDRYVTGIIYTKSGSKKDRIKLTMLISIAVQHGLDSGVLTRWPKKLLLGAHFIRADLSTFKGGMNLFADSLMTLRKTVVTKPSVRKSRKDVHNPSVINVYDKNNHPHEIQILFYDSMLFAPAGKGLADVGKLIDKPKMNIPEPYSIEEMHTFLAEQPELFKQYAINDAEICYLFMQKTLVFVFAEFGLKNLPITISGMALKSFIKSVGENYCHYFGLEARSKEVFDKSTGMVKTVINVQPTIESAMFQGFATDCYHGGRNECFVTGPTRIGEWYDFDVPSCYTVVASMLRPLNYSAARQVLSAADFCGDVFGFAYVCFKFPEATRFPCLPVKTDSYGLHFPIQGRSLCTAPEIELALSLGAEVRVIQGFIIPWHSESWVFANYMRNVRLKRLSYPKESFEERMWKEIGNSLYGKLAQGLKGKTAYDLLSQTNSQTPPSAITNPYFAAFITGFSRALLSEMISSVPGDRTVVSITTDGFLTDAPLSEINLNGTLCQRFRAMYHSINADGGEILELKNGSNQMIAVRTRGQFSVLHHESYRPVLARAGVQVPFNVDGNDYMTNLYLSRQPEQVMKRRTLTTIRKQVENKSDLVREFGNVRLNLEPDFKRKLINPRMVSVGDKQHIAFDSVPFTTSEEGVRMRQIFDLWRQRNCLKTLRDWERWLDFYSIYLLKKGKSYRINPGETPDELFARLFLRVFARSELGVSKDMTNREFADYMTKLGYATKPSALGSARGAELVEGAIPVSPSTVKLLKKLLERYPGFQYQRFFDPDSIGELTALLA